MTRRESLQAIYELAFYPPRLNDAADQIRRGDAAVREALGEMLDIALLLHGALPSGGYASQRALNRLALYQAKARAFNTVTFLRNLRRALGRPPLPLSEVPGHLVRDIGLPPLSRAGSGLEKRGRAS
jgi:hypothetical protein